MFQLHNVLFQKKKKKKNLNFFNFFFFPYKK